ncbi:MAG: hypothetical protein LBO64_00690 [Desulfovibrio sp.]|nr:hypothetical protein [Desulfovibrio sp.]
MTEDGNAYVVNYYMLGYQGDAWQALRTLPGGNVDAVITDPPYSTGAVTLAGKSSHLQFHQ